MTGKDTSGKIMIVVAIIGMIGAAISALAFYYGADRAAQEVIIKATVTAKSVTEQTQFSTPTVQIDVTSTHTNSTQTSTLKITNWQKTAFLPESLSQARSVAYNNRIYLIGGVTNEKLSDKVFQAQLLDDGNLGEWESAP